jgi:hypothetical protein
MQSQSQPASTLDRDQSYEAELILYEFCLYRSRVRFTDGQAHQTLGSRQARLECECRVSFQ